jgi:hypothetical protein
MAEVDELCAQASTYNNTTTHRSERVATTTKWFVLKLH